MICLSASPGVLCSLCCLCFPELLPEFSGRFRQCVGSNRGIHRSRSHGPSDHDPVLLRKQGCTGASWGFKWLLLSSKMLKDLTGREGVVKDSPWFTHSAFSLWSSQGVHVACGSVHHRIPFAQFPLCSFSSADVSPNEFCSHVVVEVLSLVRLLKCGTHTHTNTLQRGDFLQVPVHNGPGCPTRGWRP